MLLRSTVLLGVLLSVIGLNSAVEPSQVMQGVTQAFGKAIWFCQDQMKFADEVILKIRHFWHSDYAGTPQEMACVIHCAMTRLELIDTWGHLKQTHVDAFVKAKGADDTTAKRLLDFVTKDCTTSAVAARTNMKNVPEQCLTAMVLAECLRTGVLKMHIEPL